jgi:hypothetical protein
VERLMSEMKAKVEVRLVPCVVEDVNALEEAIDVLRNLGKLHRDDHFHDLANRIYLLHDRIYMATRIGLETRVTPDDRWMQFEESE